MCSTIFLRRGGNCFCILERWENGFWCVIGIAKYLGIDGAHYFTWLSVHLFGNTHLICPQHIFTYFSGIGQFSRSICIFLLYGI